MNKTTMRTLALILGILFYAAIAVSQPGGPDSVTPESSERANLSGAGVSIEAMAGNVSEVSISASQITNGWQGFYGNISGNIVLADSANNVFYNWTGLGSLSGEVYASRDSAVDWSTINCSNTTEIQTETAFIDRTGSSDSVENTFNATNHPSFQVGSITLSANACNSTNAYASSGFSSTDFYQVLLADGGGDMVYTTLIDENQAGFNGVAYDFELLVGENGNATNLGSTSYFFYIELS